MEDYINQQSTIELLRDQENHMKKQRLLDLQIQQLEQNSTQSRQGMYSGLKWLKSAIRKWIYLFLK